MDIEEEVDPNKMIVDTPLSNAAASEEEEARQAIDMLRGDDVSGRVAAANRLESVAAALGEERTRDELLPFLTDGVDDEDEVLVAIASNLGKLIEHVGGPAHAHTLLPCLELLLTVEETAVRDAASASTQAVANVLPKETFQDQYARMVSRLATNEWFTARISSAALIATAYTRLKEEDQKEFQSHYSSLCRDDTPMVRRVAAQYLGSMLETVIQVSGRNCLEEEGTVTTLFIPLYEELASNEQPDSVRLQTTGNCVAFGRAISEVVKDGKYTESEMALVNRVLPLIVATIDDRSWRVRWTAASKFADVIAAFDGVPDAMDSLVPAYEKLLQDPEAEVRTAATFNLADVAKCKAQVPRTTRALDDTAAAADETRVIVAERLVKRVTSLTEDDSEHVRAALAMVATELAPILGKDDTISYLVPPVLLLLRDAASEVRLNLISSLGSLNEVIGVDLLSQSLLPAILDLAQDGKWRIRLAIIQHIPLLAKQLGKDFFSEKLASLCVGWLGDDISSIRQAAATNLKELTALFGTDWATEYLIPSIKEISQHQSYLRRITAVQVCALMSTEMEEDVVILELLPLILQMACDLVPNIRFNVAKGLEMMAPVCGKSIYETQVRPVLALLVEDTDRDVRFFASQTMKKMDEQLLASDN
jgi:serine/threonine-protein phosphatase 2A regulatory subunit A